MSSGNSPRGPGSGERSSSRGRPGPPQGGPRSGSPAGNAPSSASPFPPSVGYDPARDNIEKTDEGLNKRVDLPPEAFKGVCERETLYARRPGFNTSGGTKIMVEVNQYRVTQMSNITVYQYDVSCSPEPEKDIVWKKLWDSAKVREKLESIKQPWIYDGRRLAWCTAKLPEMRITIDLDEDKGRPSRGDNVFYMRIKTVTEVHLEALGAYLTGQMSWDNSVLECMSFLDHVLRQGPASRMHMLKRTFFDENAERKKLNRYTEAIKGVYASIRLNQSIAVKGGLGLGVNVDVSNQAFFIPQSFEALIQSYFACVDRKYASLSMHELAKALRPVWDDEKKRWEQSEAFKLLKKLHKIRFEIAYRNKVIDKEYKVKSFTFDEKYGGEGAHAKSVKFEKKMPDGTPREYSIAEYYKEMYNITLKYPLFPLIETNRDGCFPVELCRVKKWNPYPFKLDPDQTSEMIKFAVQRPPQRKQDIQKMVQLLKWDDDKFLTSFGLRMNPTMPQVQAMVLQNPQIEFRDVHNKTKLINPKFTGRWDLRGCKFVKHNEEPLRSWAFVITEGCVDKETVKNFIRVFKDTYRSHGGIIERDPQIYEFPPKKPQPLLIEEAYNQCGASTKLVPQLMFVILKDKIGWVYERMKKNLDCRWACLSQMVQAYHVKKAAAQYCSNVAMKVNAKLGGQTSRIHTPGRSGFFSKPTMMIGVDVSHPSPGSLLASMAAMTVSMDKDAAVYAAGVESNGYRTEVLSGHNTHKLLDPIVQRWVAQHQCMPEHVFYFRDGVSEGQFAQVMEYELGELKVMFKRVLKGKCPKITVIICTKRHHIRFFPMSDKDKNGNPLPGTLVEREVTHPFHYDFYLCSHVAIQGTARPVHYQVIHDEIKMKPDDLQKMIYEQCYQYCRSTTPVSLHPAVYYAHLACNRARHHENVPTSEQVPKSVRPQILPKRGIMAKVDPDENTIKRYATPMPLMPMGDKEAKPAARVIFPKRMWYV